MSAAIAAEDESTFTGILTASDAYHASLEESHRLLRDPTTLQALILSRKNPLEAYDSIGNDLDRIFSRYALNLVISSAKAGHFCYCLYLSPMNCTNITYIY